MAGLGPAIHAFLPFDGDLAKTWVAGTSPATGPWFASHTIMSLTRIRSSRQSNAGLALNLRQ